MTRLLMLLLAAVLFSGPAHAGIDDAINNFTAPIATVIGQIVFFKITIAGAELPLVVLWLVAGAVFFTFYMGFVNIRGFGHAIRLGRGDYDPAKRSQ